MTREERIDGFIKAITAWGGEDYPAYESFYTDENKALYESWLREQPKVDGKTLFRGYVFDADYFGLEYLHVGDILCMDNLTQLDMPSFSSTLQLYCFEFGEVTLSDNIKVVFEVNTHGKYFVDISEKSFYKSEREYKCTSDVKLKIESIAKKHGYWHIKLEEV